MTTADTEDGTALLKETILRLLQVAPLLMPAIAAVGAAIGLYQYSKAQRWKRSEVVAEQIKQFEDNPLVRRAMFMLDFKHGTFVADPCVAKRCEVKPDIRSKAFTTSVWTFIDAYGYTGVRASRRSYNRRRRSCRPKSTCWCQRSSSRRPWRPARRYRPAHRILCTLSGPPAVPNRSQGTDLMRR